MNEIIPVTICTMATERSDYALTGVVLVVVLLVTTLTTNAVESRSVQIYGVSSVAWCALIALGIQWLAWIPASLLQTERFYDLLGGVTYLALVVFSLWAGSQNHGVSTREVVISLLVVVWTIRLSGFLFLRIHNSGKDGRFDHLKTSAIRFLVPWTLQAMWVFLTMIVVIVINSQAVDSAPMNIFDAIGVSLWVAGFAIEVIADAQKSRFKTEPDNRGKWIDEGLWSLSRHPNYLGEIVLWTGIAVMGTGSLEGTELAAWISPVFVCLLLTKVSGVPILDKRGNEKWGDDPEYQKYVDNTPMLVPRLRFNR